MVDDSAPVTTPPADYATYAERTEDPRFTDWLRARTPDWEAATNHRFVDELGADTIDDAVYRRYLLQDYAFVDHLVGTFGHALGHAPTREAQSRFAEFIGTVTTDENDYFERSFAALDVPEAEYAEPELTPTTRAFVDLLGRASNEGGYAETLAVLVPAEWVYLSWATARSDADPSRFYLAEWIDLHAVPAFETFVGWLRAELDREGAAASPRRQQRIENLFRRTVELEVAFFDDAYAGSE